MVSGALALAATSTHDAIAAAEACRPAQFAQRRAAQGLCRQRPGQDVVTLQYKDKPLTIYRARLGSAPLGVVFQVSERGYSGEILVLMAVDVDGKMLARACSKHTETPGLGDKLKSPKTNGFSASTANRWASRRQTNGA